MSGFITVERDLWDHQVFKSEPMSEREAWIWMISKAAYAGTKHRVGANLVDVERGSFMVTLRELQSAFMWQSDKRVRNFLKKLENHGMLTVLTLGERNARKTHVSICNYEEYQSTGRSKDAAKTHGGRSKDAVNKQGNKETRKDTNVSLGASVPECLPQTVSSQKRRATQIPEDSVLSDEFFSVAVEKMGLDRRQAEAQFERFRDHALSQGRTCKDWKAAWRNWLTSPHFKIITVGVPNAHSSRPTPFATSANRGHGPSSMASIAARRALERQAGG